MEITKTKLDGVLLIKPPTHFEDFRGEYVELYNEELYTQAGIGVKFVQDDISVSSRHVLRGIHGDQATWKLVSCLQGTFYLVILDYRRESPQYGQWTAITLSDKNRLQVLIPPGFGNGHVVMSEQSVFHYKQSTYYNRPGQFTVRWNDPAFKIFWPVPAPIVSERDLG